MAIDPNTLQLWFHYEEIAMHFNQLIIQYRLQLMAGIGAIGAVSGYLISSKDTISPDMRHKYIACVSAGLLFILAAAATLDLFYYNELLLGAVKALLELERQHKGLNMSTYISGQFSNNSSYAVYGAYALVILPLFIFTLWSWYVVIFRPTKTEDD